MIRKQTKLWTTQDGRKIRICDLTNSHLCSVIKMIVRNGSFKFLASALAAYQYAATAPDGACLCAEREADQLMYIAEQHDFIAYCTLWPWLVREAARRKISLEYTDGLLVSKVTCVSAQGDEL